MPFRPPRDGSGQLSFFDPSSEPLTISQLTRYVKSLLEGDYVLQDVWVAGEISNLRVTASGHAYFSLKDDQSSLRGVMWRSDVARHGILPQDGQSVLAHGHVSVYEAAGNYQLYVDHLQSVGMGRLYLEFEALKQRLADQGLFDAGRKRPLPPFPRRLGIVTSATAAALQDILNVLARRYPPVEVLIAPTLVQGDQAPPQIVAAIQALNDHAQVDVIIVARGGGSLEDLWAFNDERVARAIAASRAPVISGVGHEIDFTIADFAADVRAPTPSAAAELAVPDRFELLTGLRSQHSRLIGALQHQLDARRQKLAQLTQALRRNSPGRRIENLRQRTDELAQSTGVAAGHLLALRREQLNGLTGRLATLSPLATLDRGYAIVRHGQTERVVTSTAHVATGDPLVIRVRQGEFGATVVSDQTE
ncbi:MAG: exodeoxyribonuclease VII large subunit [Chloroflexota bacterium]